MKTKEKSYLKYTIKIREYYTEVKTKRGSEKREKFWVIQLSDKHSNRFCRFDNKKEMLRWLEDETYFEVRKRRKE